MPCCSSLKSWLSPSLNAHVILHLWTCTCTHTYTYISNTATKALAFVESLALRVHFLSSKPGSNTAFSGQPSLLLSYWALSLLLYTSVLAISSTLPFIIGDWTFDFLSRKWASGSLVTLVSRIFTKSIFNKFFIENKIPSGWMSEQFHLCVWNRDPWEKK